MTVKLKKYILFPNWNIERKKVHFKTGHNWFLGLIEIVKSHVKDKSVW